MSLNTDRTELLATMGKVDAAAAAAAVRGDKW
jgi:hypothetical protein